MTLCMKIVERNSPGLADGHTKNVRKWGRRISCPGKRTDVRNDGLGSTHNAQDAHACDFHCGKRLINKNLALLIVHTSLRYNEKTATPRRAISPDVWCCQFQFKPSFPIVV